MKRPAKFPCNAAYKRKIGSIDYCKEVAGKGTEHAGVGPCKKHDAMCEAVATIDRREEKPGAFKGGFYHYNLKVKGPLKEKLEALGGDTIYFNPDGHLANLTFEIVAAKAIAAQMVEDFDEHHAALLDWHKMFKSGLTDMQPPKITTMKDVQEVLLISARIAGLAKTIHDLVPLRTVEGMCYQMGRILERHVVNTVERNAVKEQFIELTKVFHDMPGMARPRFQTKVPGQQLPYAQLPRETV